ncbi:MAG: hypothetical protein JWQ87_2502 [Candidatus Sulfotelmatobacter sp.]|nr:hypothetical protein [Candidatus Sulfotelmatobacter sp.]
MSTSAVSSTSLSQLQQYFQTRHTDLKQLGQALRTGDLAGAQTAYNNIVALGQNGPFPGGNPFKVNQREQDFTSIGQALQSGDLAAAQHAFATLGSTFSNGRALDPSPTSPPVAASGPEIVLNLSNITSTSGGSASPEQITINISNPASGGEQVSIGSGSQGSNQQQVTFNLPSNSNEQIVLNLLGATSTSSGSSTNTTGGSNAGGGISVSA